MKNAILNGRSPQLLGKINKESGRFWPKSPNFSFAVDSEILSAKFLLDEHVY